MSGENKTTGPRPVWEPGPMDMMDDVIAFQQRDIMWLEAETRRLGFAIQRAYEILCAGHPPHSARESNARRVLRHALEGQHVTS